MKKNKVLALGFLVDDIMSGVCLLMSSTNPMNQYCGSKFHWILGYNTSN